MIYVDMFKCDQKTNSSSNDGYIKLNRGLLSNYTAKVGDRIRLECEFDSNTDIDTIYWIRNLEEIIQPIRGKILITRKNLTTTYVLIAFLFYCIIFGIFLMFFQYYFYF